jgi:Ca2+-binding EF-hand superfamily protein
MLMLRVADLKAGLANLATGVTEEEAEALWKTFDADGDGTLDLAELQALFTEQATTAIQSIYARIASYADALSRSRTVDELLDKFDADGDGKVQKSEFIKLAVTGVKIPTPDLYDLYDPKQNQLEDSDFEVLSQSLRTGDVADSGDLMLDLKEAIGGVEYPSGAVINHVGNLTKGVTEAQAARSWELYDHDGNGVMDRSELRRLVHDLGNAIIRRLSNKVERISKQMSKPKDSAKELLKALDKNRDGRVQKVEFVNLAIRGLDNIDAMSPDERGGSSRGPPSKRTKVQDEARALKTARRGEPGFEMIHVRRS